MVWNSLPAQLAKENKRFVYKAERNVKSQSLKSYLTRYRPSLAIRASMLPHVIQPIPLDAVTCRFHNLSLYAVSQLREEVAGGLHAESVS